MPQLSQPPVPHESQPPQESQQSVPHESQHPPQGAHSLQQPQGLQQNIFSRQQHPVLLVTDTAATIANIKRFMGRKFLSSELLGVTRPKGPILSVAQLSPPVEFRRVREPGGTQRIPTALTAPLTRTLTESPYEVVSAAQSIKLRNPSPLAQPV